MLIGREAERRVLARTVAAARVAEAGTLVLVGEPGIGKTALLDELAHRSEDVRVLRVRGSESEQNLPFGGLDQLLRPLLGLLASIPVPQARALGVALSLESDSDPGVRAERFAIGAATLSMLSRAAEDRAVLVLVDDAQWLDQPSWEALTFASRRLLADPVALVLASRPSATVERAGLTRIDLPGLAPDEVSALLHHHTGRRVPAALGHRVWDATAGNPLAVLEVAADLDAVEQLVPTSPVDVPQRVLAAYTARTANLPADTRMALLAASIARPADLPAVLDLLGLTFEDLRPGEVEGLVDLGPGVVEFRHPLARASAYALASPEQRRRVHLAVAAATHDEERRAWHLAEGTVGVDDAVADRVANVAGENLRRGAHSVAATGYQRAAALTSARELRSSRLTAAGEAAALAGQGARARALLDEAASQAATSVQRGRVDGLRAAVEQRWGSLEASRDLGERALPRLVREDPGAAVETSADLVATCFYLGDTDACGGTAAVLAEFLPRVPESHRRLAQLAMGVGLVVAGRDGVETIRSAVAGAASDGSVAAEDLRPGWMMTGPLFLREDTAAERALVDSALGWLRERAAIGSLASLLFLVARYAASTHRWSEATAPYEEGIALAREAGQTTDLTLLLAGLAWLESRTGAQDGCREHSAEALALARRHHVHLARIWASYALGDLALGAGHPEVAVEEYAALQAFLDRIRFRDVDMCPHPERVECLVSMGRESEARPLAEDYATRASAKGQPWARARAERSLALFADDPLPGLDRARTLQQESPDQFERARTDLLLGQVLRRVRQRTAARDALRAAVTGFDALGARPWAERAAVELAATGEHVHRRRDGTLEALTPQERQVATLLASGLSTRAAAAAMFLSPKTVEYHLRHVYTKLGVNNRADLALAMGS